MTDPSSNLNRRRFLQVSAGTAASAFGVGWLGSSIGSSTSAHGLRQEPVVHRPAEPLNLVLICLDTVRADHVGCYAGDGIRPDRAARTPSIDALAREGLRFSRARPEALPTGPTRRSVFTGMRTFPMDNWKPTADSPAIYGWQPPPRGQATLDSLLRRAGYRTALATDNTWLLKPSWARFRQGWDDVLDVQGQEYQRVRGGKRAERIDLEHYLVRGLRRKDRDRVRTYSGVVERYLKNQAGREREEDWSSPKVFSAAMDWVDRHNRERPTQPFALVVDSYDPHEPWDPPKKYVDLYDDPDYRGREPISPLYGGDDYLSRREKQRMRALYKAELTMADKWVGARLEKLDALRLMERTVVVFYSDHGHSLSDRGIVGKAPDQMYAEMVDVPLIARHPEGRKAGTSTDHLAMLHDITPTCLGMLGIQPPDRLEGHDLSPLFHDEATQSRRVQTAGYNDYVWASDGRYTYIDTNRFVNPKLFDRRRDPRERRDISSAHPQRVKRFREAVLRDAGGKPPPRYRR